MATDTATTDTNTASKAPRVRKGKPKAPDVCRLTLHIRGVPYGVKPVACDRGTARQCYALRKADGTTYHVSRHDHGAECDCGDQTFRHDGIDAQGCKHIRALVALGILDTRPALVRSPPPSAFDEDDIESDPESWPSWADGTRYATSR